MKRCPFQCLDSNSAMQIQKLVVALLLTVSAASAAHGVDLSSWNVDIQLNEDRSVDWTVTLAYKDFVDKDDYWVLARVSEFSVLADGQQVDCRKAPQEFGTSIVCDELNAKTIIFNIKTIDQVGSFNNFNMFSYTFDITRFTDKFTLVTTIPLGSGLVSVEQLKGTGLAPFSPAFGKEGTDGRQIFVTWDLQNPNLGESINERLIFEPVVGPITEVAILVLIVIAVLLTGYFRFLRRDVKHVLPILTTSERAVVQIVMDRKSVDQRDIVRETDFSKAKVSRILKSLEGRGLIRTRPKGRTKVVKLSDGSRREEPEEKKEERKKENVIKKLLGK